MKREKGVRQERMTERNRKERKREKEQECTREKNHTVVICFQGNPLFIGFLPD